MRPSARVAQRKLGDCMGGSASSRSLPPFPWTALSRVLKTLRLAGLSRHALWHGPWPAPGLGLDSARGRRYLLGPVEQTATRVKPPRTKFPLPIAAATRRTWFG